MSETEFKPFYLNTMGGKKKPCKMTDANGNTKNFGSITEAADWLIDHEYAKTHTRAAICNISQAIHNKVKAYGFAWDWA